MESINNLSVDWAKVEYLEKLGNGLSGTIYLALYDNIEYAVKKIVLLSKESWHIFSNEIIYMYLLQGYNGITKLYDFTILKEDGYYVYYLMMELGTCNLKEFVNNNPTYFNSYDNLINFILQVLDGISLMSSNSIAHRDLKIDNILYFEKSNEFRINDFGCAVDVVKNDRRQHRGYIVYCPPEVRFGKIYNYHKNDIFSLGLIVLQCIGVMKDPNDLTQIKAENSFNDYKKSLLDKVKQIHQQEELLNFLTGILEYKADKRLSPNEAALILNKEFNEDKNLFNNSLSGFIYLRVGENYLSYSDDEVTVSMVKDNSCKFELIPICSGKYLIKLDNKSHLASTMVNLNKISFSDKISPHEEWLIVRYKDIYFLRNHNLHFLSITEERVSLSGLLGESEKINIEI
jgi:serine/threonine protein kinase